MCVVSMLGDDWGRRFPKSWPEIPLTPDRPLINLDNYITKEEFNKLKNEVEELKKLLLAAKEYDKATGQPNCEMDEKVALIKKIAEAVGVNVDAVFK